ncbi:CA174 protein, partial [Atrichornis clamosus]|nr:CA174 protein [Atrichornis clamosus]
CSSHEAAEGQPAKRIKCDKSSLKSELEGLTGKTRNLAALGEMPKTSDGDRGSEDQGDSNIIQQEKGATILGTNEGKQEKERDVSLEPHAVKPSSTPLKMGIGGYLHHHVFSEEESSCGSLDGATSEDADHPRRPMLLEHSSGLSDEDSNQPMPVHRFFGDIELIFLSDSIFFLQDLPAVAPPNMTRSRREARKLHFIAKEDEEDEEEEE